MKLEILSLRYHQAAQAKRWLAELPGTGTAYLTDRLYELHPEGGRTWMYPGGPEHWVELPRPGDLDAAEVATNLSTMVDILPPTERQARRLTRLAPEDTACMTCWSCTQQHNHNE